MGVPLKQQLHMAKYIIGKRLRNIKRYPLVLMLEPLYQCNLACAGCGKIDHPKEILAKRMSVQDALKAVDECGAPMVSIAGGEPLIHENIPQIVQGIIARKKYVYLCTNALLLKKRIHEFTPSPYLTFSIHLDGNRERHDESVCRTGVYDKAVKAIQLAKEHGHRVSINCTLFNNEDAAEVVDFFDSVTAMGIDQITLSPGYSYEHAPRQDVFLSRTQTKQLFRNILKKRKEKTKNWPLSHSPLFLDFLAGNQTYQCTPWSNPNYGIFGWQKPCYLLSKGHTKTFKSLMENTNWEDYGSGRHPQCNNCMASCGYEGTAVNDMLSSPIKALKVALRGPKTEGTMAPELPILYNTVEKSSSTNNALADKI
ncbi:adenosyl-hopene transferase HpnH [Legionella fallonii]|uniref:Radical SAM domain Fe-S oxidoreductase n=1 Tax=Legionella fallonii LLAP-10 TaxID=1212491 RepID=A0A098GAD3_9GAMM|nr:adenosyl-hopene transferase HpnH [Legionella fallonii]CEG58980.1 Radical SAM domain Fe-S oxidoreductase [Legionella fallonii LLAP-10]